MRLPGVSSLYTVDKVSRKVRSKYTTDEALLEAMLIQRRKMLLLSVTCAVLGLGMVASNYLSRYFTGHRLSEFTLGVMLPAGIAVLLYAAEFGAIAGEIRREVMRTAYEMSQKNTVSDPGVDAS